MEATCVSKTIKYGKNRYRLHGDGSWSALAFGFFISTPNARTPRYSWISIPEDKVPEEVRKEANA